jgi:probable F420-dependent oxidoreductase
MRLGIALPNYGPLATPEALRRLAATAEEAGADSIWVSDHLVAPVDVRSIYPYERRPDAQPGALGVIEEFFEPLTTLAVLAGSTTRVGLGVSAYVMPYRHPVVTAKQVATLDVLSGGRIVLAVGVGWLREEFEALGVPFERRGRRTEEYLAVCRALWAGGEARYDGELIRLPPVRTGPRPAQRPHPPIWIAGNSPAAIGRAARIGDGWHAIDLRADEIRPAVRRLRAAAATHGRDPASLVVSLRTTVAPGGPPGRPFAGDRDAVRRDRDACARAGVTALIANVRGGVASVEAAAERIRAIVAAMRS